MFSDNVYYAPKYKCACTPITSATVHGTSQRAPGVVQSQFVHECVMERIARSVGQPHATVRAMTIQSHPEPMFQIQERNFYQVNQVTPYGDHIGTVDFDWTISQLWKELHDTADIEVRRASVAAFNKANKWRKRGLALQPIK